MISEEIEEKICNWLAKYCFLNIRLTVLNNVIHIVDNDEDEIVSMFFEEELKVVDRYLRIKKINL